MTFKRNIFTLAAFLTCAATTDLTASQPPQVVKKYFIGTYPATHWALQPYTLTDPKVIALARYMNAEYALYMNPTDKRGYRSLIRLIQNNDMASTINRDYTSEERIGLNLLIALMTDTYSHIAPIVQSAVAGNNAHALESESGIPLLGVPHEPSFLHGHIWARGNPNGCYIEDVKLDGPIPGLNFDMMATTWQRKTDNEFELQAGNDKKIPWKSGDMEKVVARLKSEIVETKEPYEALGVIISFE
jgi:hypothetical protein